jgi:hypothetical protein
MIVHPFCNGASRTFDPMRADHEAVGAHERLASTVVPRSGDQNLQPENLAKTRASYFFQHETKQQKSNCPSGA